MSVQRCNGAGLTGCVIDSAGRDIQLAEQLVDQASDQGLDLVGPDGVLTGLTKRVLEAGLDLS